MSDRTTLEAGDGHNFGAYYSRPSAEPRGALVIIQEIFGVNSHIREVCDRFAADGWLAVAPAMFDRAEGDVELDYDQDGAKRGLGLRAEIGLEDSLADIAATAESAAAEVGTPSLVGIVGYCWGGSLAAAAACRLPELFGAAVGYYGGQVVDLIDADPGVPLMLHFGEADAGIPLDDVAKIEAAWPDVPVHIHGGAGHGFNCDVRASYHEHAATDASKLTSAFLTKYLNKQ